MALYGLAEYAGAEAACQQMRKIYPRNKLAVAELARTRARIAELTNRIYPIRKMYNDVAVLRPPHLDLASYLDLVIVKESPGRGRGLFTTKAVKAGELLLCEKAFAHAFSDSTESGAAASSKTSLLTTLPQIE
jgi:hypothetical protein